MLVTFIYIDFFSCSSLSIRTCLVVRLYLYRLVRLFTFIYIDFFGCSALSSWTCFVVRLYLHGLDCLSLLGCLSFYLHGLVWLFAFSYIDLFGCLPLSSYRADAKKRALSNDIVTVLKTHGKRRALADVNCNCNMTSIVALDGVRSFLRLFM